MFNLRNLCSNTFKEFRSTEIKYFLNEKIRLCSPAKTKTKQSCRFVQVTTVETR